MNGEKVSTCPACSNVGIILGDNPRHYTQFASPTQIRVMTMINAQCAKCGHKWGIKLMSLNITELAQEADEQFAIADAEALVRGVA